jgi:hypothetical protein
MIDWPVAFSTVSHALKLVQELRSIDKELSHADLKLKIADLTSALADIKITLSEAKTEAADKDAEIVRLKALHRRLDIDTIEMHGYRYRKNSVGEPAGTPFCPVCLEKHGYLFELAHGEHFGQALKCPDCNASYGNMPVYND